MITDWELWACANKLIEMHGEGAALHAQLRADVLAEDGEEEGARTWRLIMQRV